jgi:hypothetical protein
MNQPIPRATIYRLAIFGFDYIEAKNLEFIESQSSEDENIVLRFIPKGKRTVETLSQRSSPIIVILEGWGHPEFNNYKPPVQSGQLVSFEQRYPTLSPEWGIAFDEFLSQHLKQSNSRIVAVYRRELNKPILQLETQQNIGAAEEPLITEVSENVITEGAVTQSLENDYERNQEARRLCIAHYGIRCQICGFDFKEVYGEIGSDYIHVHHIVPISQRQGEYEVNPITDLLPVCPNCHAMLHRRNPPFTAQEMRLTLKQIWSR